MTLLVTNETAKSKITTGTSALFKVGKLKVAFQTKKAGNDESQPPSEVLIASPIDAGVYPVILFVHGFFLRNTYYSQLIEHISSHGYIVVAPLLFSVLQLPQSSTEDVSSTAAVANWLPSGLQSLLPTVVKPDFEKFTLAGHSRGGQTVFSVALGYAKINLPVKLASIIGIDPVAGTSKSFQLEPRILNYKPNSFNLGGIPALVIGSGLGPDAIFPFVPACAPEGVNHTEFYNECPPSCYHFVVTDYGHLDFLDDNACNLVTECICKHGKCREIMRQCTGGIVVAFLKDCFEEEAGYLKEIIAKPVLAPGKLDPVQYKIDPVQSRLKCKL